MVDYLGDTIKAWVSKDFSKCQLSSRYKPFTLLLLNLPSFYIHSNKKSSGLVYQETCKLIKIYEKMPEEG